MKSSPLILNSLDDAGRRLVRTEVESKDPKNEHWLQELLYNHPELLPVEDFDDSFAPAIPVGREVPTGSGPIDNLYVSPDGGITIVETKLWKNPEKHRTVVAQVIDYAKELAAWDYDQLCEAILTSSRRREETEKAALEEKMSAALREAGLELHEFQENVAASLHDGNFLLLIVGDRVSPNIALLTSSIQSAPGLAFTIRLVEMQLFQATPGEDWPLFVVPEVVGRTVEKTRGVVRVRYNQEQPKIEIEVESEDDDLNEVTRGLDLDLFLRQIPKDLSEPYREGVEEWKGIGGNIHFTNKMMHFQMEFSGEQWRMVRCRKRQVSIIQQKGVEYYSGDAGPYERYLRDLESSPVVSRYARDGRQWINYDKLSADDLRVLLLAARELAQNMKSEE